MAAQPRALCHTFRVTTQESRGDGRHTPTRKLRAPDDLWDAYGSVCKRVLGRDRSKDLLEHMITTVRKHGNAEERAKLARAEAEINERRSRKGGRPRKGK